MSTANMRTQSEAALKREADKRIKRVGTAAKQLEEDLTWIVNHKAWELHGFKDFPDYFEDRNGYPMPPVVRNIVAYALFDEGMRTQGRSKSGEVRPGHSIADVARMLGMPIKITKSGTETSTSVSALRSQYRSGMPAAEATISRWPVRNRGQNRQVGAGPDEFIQIGFMMPRRVRDWYRNEAKTAVTPVPDAELYRQVLIAHMDKVEAGRKASRRTSRSKGRAA